MEEEMLVNRLESLRSNNVFMTNLSYALFVHLIPQYKNREPAMCDLLECLVQAVVAEILSLVLRFYNGKNLDPDTVARLQESAFLSLKPKAPQRLLPQLWKALRFHINEHWSLVLGSISITNIAPIVQTFSDRILKVEDPNNQGIDTLVTYYRAQRYLIYNPYDPAKTSSFLHFLSENVRLLNNFTNTQLRGLMLEILDRALSQIDFSGDDKLADVAVPFAQIFEQVQLLYGQLQKYKRMPDLRPITYRLIVNIVIRSYSSFHDVHVQKLLKKIFKNVAREKEKETCLWCILRILRGPRHFHLSPENVPRFITTSRNKLIIGTSFEQRKTAIEKSYGYGMRWPVKNDEASVLSFMQHVSDAIFPPKKILPDILETMDILVNIVVQLAANSLEWTVNNTLRTLLSYESRFAEYALIAMRALHVVLDPFSSFASGCVNNPINKRLNITDKLEEMLEILCPQVQQIVWKADEFVGIKLVGTNKMAFEYSNVADEVSPDARIGVIDAGLDTNDLSALAAAGSREKAPMHLHVLYDALKCFPLLGVQLEPEVFVVAAQLLAHPDHNLAVVSSRSLQLICRLNPQLAPRLVCSLVHLLNHPAFQHSGAAITLVSHIVGFLELWTTLGGVGAPLPMRSKTFVRPRFQTGAPVLKTAASFGGKLPDQKAGGVAVPDDYTWIFEAESAALLLMTHAESKVRLMAVKIYENVGKLYSGLSEDEKISVLGEHRVLAALMETSGKEIIRTALRRYMIDVNLAEDPKGNTSSLLTDRAQTPSLTSILSGVPPLWVRVLSSLGPVCIDNLHPKTIETLRSRLTERLKLLGMSIASDDMIASWCGAAVLHLSTAGTNSSGWHSSPSNGNIPLPSPSTVAALSNIHVNLVGFLNEAFQQLFSIDHETWQWALATALSSLHHQSLSIGVQALWQWVQNKMKKKSSKKKTAMTLSLSRILKMVAQSPELSWAFAADKDLSSLQVFLEFLSSQNLASLTLDAPATPSSAELRVDIIVIVKHIADGLVEAKRNAGASMWQLESRHQLFEWLLHLVPVPSGYSQASHRPEPKEDDRLVRDAVRNLCRLGRLFQFKTPYATLPANQLEWILVAEEGGYNILANILHNHFTELYPTFVDRAFSETRVRSELFFRAIVDNFLKMGVRLEQKDEIRIPLLHLVLFNLTDPLRSVRHQSFELLLWLVSESILQQPENDDPMVAEDFNAIMRQTAFAFEADDASSAQCFVDVVYNLIAEVCASLAPNFFADVFKRRAILKYLPHGLARSLLYLGPWASNVVLDRTHVPTDRDFGSLFFPMSNEFFLNELFNYTTCFAPENRKEIVGLWQTIAKVSISGNLPVLVEFVALKASESPANLPICRELVHFLARVDSKTTVKLLMKPILALPGPVQELDKELEIEVPTTTAPHIEVISQPLPTITETGVTPDPVSGGLVPSWLAPHQRRSRVEADSVRDELRMSLSKMLKKHEAVDFSQLTASLTIREAEVAEDSSDEDGSSSESDSEYIPVSTLPPAPLSPMNAAAGLASLSSPPPPPTGPPPPRPVVQLLPEPVEPEDTQAPAQAEAVERTSAPVQVWTKDLSSKRRPSQDASTSRAAKQQAAIAAALLMDLPRECFESMVEFFHILFVYAVLNVDSTIDHGRSSNTTLLSNTTDGIEKSTFTKLLLSLLEGLRHYIRSQQQDITDEQAELFRKMTRSMQDDNFKLRWKLGHSSTDVVFPRAFRQSNAEPMPDPTTSRRYSSLYAPTELHAVGCDAHVFLNDFAACVGVAATMKSAQNRITEQILQWCLVCKDPALALKAHKAYSALGSNLDKGTVRLLLRSLSAALDKLRVFEEQQINRMPSSSYVNESHYYFSCLVAEILHIVKAWFDRTQVHDQMLNYPELFWTIVALLRVARKNKLYHTALNLLSSFLSAGELIDAINNDAAANANFKRFALSWSPHFEGIQPLLEKGLLEDNLEDLCLSLLISLTNIQDSAFIRHPPSLVHYLYTLLDVMPWLHEKLLLRAKPRHANLVPAEAANILADYLGKSTLPVEGIQRILSAYGTEEYPMGLAGANKFLKNMSAEIINAFFPAYSSVAADFLILLLTEGSPRYHVFALKMASALLGHENSLDYIAYFDQIIQIASDYAYFRKVASVPIRQASIELLDQVIHVCGVLLSMFSVDSDKDSQRPVPRLPESFGFAGAALQQVLEKM
eukprot:GILJ01004220.1.p1 GENE.GILJ01004220.1~~GILJ01004220.1.p1  ORF type:complete len:2256 (+),score=386.83 GILJ01004220.1:217-6768(+)